MPQIRMTPDTYAAAERVRQAVGAKSVTELVQALVEVAETEERYPPPKNLAESVLARSRAALGYMRKAAPSTTEARS